MRRLLPAAAGLLLVLALPTLASAHEITNVHVDCDGQAIHVSGKLFGQDGGATVTVTGPDSYSESFFADQDEEWTVVLPLGQDGSYMIDWPDSGDFGPVEFAVDCEQEQVEPTQAAAPTPAPTPEATEAPAPTPTEQTVVLPDEGVAPTPTGAVIPALGSTTGGPVPTLPPTDTSAAADTESPPAEMAGLVLLGLAASFAWVAVSAIDRRIDQRERSRSRTNSVR